MFHRLYCPGHRMGILVLACTVALTIEQPAWPASCVGPAPLEAASPSHRIRSLLRFGNLVREIITVRVACPGLSSWLKLEPNSSRLSYLLGLSLFTAESCRPPLPPFGIRLKLDQKTKRRILLASPCPTCAAR